MLFLPSSSPCIFFSFSCFSVFWYIDACREGDRLCRSLSVAAMDHTIDHSIGSVTEIDTTSLANAAAMRAAAVEGSVVVVSSSAEAASAEDIPYTTMVHHC